MSTAVIHCPGCRAPLAITPDLVGQTIACPQCKQQIQLAQAPQPEANRPGPNPVEAAWPSPAANPSGGVALAVTTSSSGGPASKPRGAPKAVAIGIVVLVGWGVAACMLVAAAVLFFVLRGGSGEQAEAVTKPAKKRPAVVSKTPNFAAPVAPTHSKSTTNWQPAASSPSHIASAPPVFAPPIHGQPINNPAPFVAPRPAPPMGIAPRPGVSPRPEPQPKQPPTPAPGNPLTGLASTCKLPALISTQAETLTTLASAPTEPLGVSIRSLAADVLPAAAFFAEADAAGDAWTVSFVTDLEQGSGKVALGTIRREGLDLRFAWAQPPADPALRKQLANCLLELRHGSATHLAQMREPHQPGSLRLDMQEGIQTKEFSLSDMPKLDTLRLEIQELAGFPSGVELPDDDKSLALGKRAAIKFTDMPGAEIGLQLNKLPAGGVVVRLQAEFKENATEKFELSLSRLGELEEGVTKSLAKAKNELPGAQANWSNLQDSLQAAARTRASNLQEQAAKDRLVSSLSSKTKLAANKIKSLQRQIAEGEARLAAVPKMRTFLDSLHQKAEIRYLVSAECGERDLLLVDGVGPAPTSENVGGAE